VLVAIDTSTEIASLALVNEDRTLAEFTWHSEQNHTTQLLPNLKYLLNLTVATPKELNGVVVAKGPGSFNGLRVGISAAKGLAFSLNIPIVGIDSLEVEAYQYAEIGLPICPVFNAGRNEITTALFQKCKDGWTRLKEDAIKTLENLCLETSEKTLFCGEYLPFITAELNSRIGDRAVIVTPVADLRRAGYLAELGMIRLKKGEVDNVSALQALYLRRPPITEAKHK
jgi:tRNA threonylcarbamoyl adenosine modification protein YeaZ